MTPVADDELMQRILAGAEKSAGVEQLEGQSLPGRRPGQRIARRPGNGRSRGANRSSG